MAQGVKRTVLNGLPYDYRADQYLVVSLDIPVIIRPDRPRSPGWPSATRRRSCRSEAHGAERPAVRLPGRPVPRRVARHPGHHTARPPAFSGLAVSDATPELLDPVVRLLRLLDRPDDLRVLAPGLEREILWRLVTGDQGALVRQIGLASSSLTHISRAIRWIREHYNEPLLVADLAALSSMSASSFHRHFRAATSMTPIQF